MVLGAGVEEGERKVPKGASSAGVPGERKAKWAWGEDCSGRRRLPLPPAAVSIPCWLTLNGKWREMLASLPPLHGQF